VREGAIELDFRDATSDLAARISMTARKFWFLAAVSMMLLWFVAGVRFRGRLWFLRRRASVSVLP
jgi:hypothetical protein